MHNVGWGCAEILPLTVVYDRRRQNVVRTSVKHSAAPRELLFLFSPQFDSISDRLQNRRIAPLNLSVNKCSGYTDNR